MTICKSGTSGKAGGLKDLNRSKWLEELRRSGTLTYAVFQRFSAFQNTELSNSLRTQPSRALIDLFAVLAGSMSWSEYLPHTLL
jgi:hypothetical protein